MEAKKEEKKETKEKTGAQKAPETATPETGVQKIVTTHGERFSLMVQKEFAGNVGTIELTSFQKRLIQNYFISTDTALKMAEDKRLKKAEDKRDIIPVIWENVNMVSLALNVVACAKIGYDPALPNQINIVPYKNNKTNKYDIGFIEGYRGKELKARKYGYLMPENVIVELIYANDKFTPIKRDMENPVETYKFKVSDNAMNRGEVVGGFYYHAFKENPESNRLVFMNLAEIEKRKPQYASVEFWGGEKDKWENGKKVGKETIEGWKDEMLYKTMYRLAYNSITIDSQKIDDDLMRMLENERLLELNRELSDPARENLRAAISNTANQNINFDDAQVINENTPDKPALEAQKINVTHSEPEPQQEQPRPNNLFATANQTNKAGF